MTHEEAIDTYINGNITDFKHWVKARAKKLDILNAIEYAEGIGIKRHVIINLMRLYLES